MMVLLPSAPRFYWGLFFDRAKVAKRAKRAAGQWTSHRLGSHAHALTTTVGKGSRVRVVRCRALLLVISLQSPFWVQAKVHTYDESLGAGSPSPLCEPVSI